MPWEVCFLRSWRMKHTAQETIRPPMCWKNTATIFICGTCGCKAAQLISRYPLSAYFCRSWCTSRLIRQYMSDIDAYLPHGQLASCQTKPAKGGGGLDMRLLYGMAAWPYHSRGNLQQADIYIYCRREMKTTGRLFATHERPTKHVSDAYRYPPHTIVLLYAHCWTVDGQLHTSTHSSGCRVVNTDEHT